MESLLELHAKDPSFLHLAQSFVKISISPQEQLCMWLSRPIAFSECLIRVAAMGSKYGHSKPSPSSGSSKPLQNADMAILLVNDGAVIEHMVSEGGGCGQSSSGQNSAELGMSMSDSRSALLVGVVSNLLRAMGNTVCHHHRNLPTAVSFMHTQH